MPTVLALSLAAFTPTPAMAQAPSEATWRLDHIFADVAAYEAARKATAADVAAFEPACRGKLGADAATLLACLERSTALNQALGRLRAYTSNHVSGDARDAAWQARDMEVNALSTKLDEATAWVAPELLAVGAERVEAMIAAEPKLAPYAYPLRRVLRRAAHTLSPETERVLALSGAVTSAPSETYGLFANAELPWPELTLPDGTKSTLRQADYARLRTHPDPAFRRQVFDTFFGAWKAYEGTVGSLLATTVQGHWFAAQARGYGSSVEASLANEFLPRETYDALIRSARANLPALHRYFALRKRMLGLDELTYADLYVPLVESDRKWTLAESEAATLAAVAPLGSAYVEGMRAGIHGGWTDVYPREGKRSGAYMDDQAYGVHPYVLLNHNDDFESASTFAHEWGHAMHSQLAMQTQPYPTVGYATFIAEIASTFNEALLVDHLLKKAKTDDERLFYLNSALEALRGTYFRQAMFGEFELQIHEAVERGEPLTGAELTARYAKLLREYHGSAQGVVRVDDVWTTEWAYIPHFHYDFYVWQYATSIAASSLLAERVLDKEKGAVDRYLALLKAGGSDDPVELLKRAGVDMTTSAPHDAVAARMTAIMDEMEKILAKRGR